MQCTSSHLAPATSEEEEEDQEDDDDDDDDDDEWFDDDDGAKPAGKPKPPAKPPAKPLSSSITALCGAQAEHTLLLPRSCRTWFDEARNQIRLPARILVSVYGF